MSYGCSNLKFLCSLEFWNSFSCAQFLFNLTTESVTMVQIKVVDNFFIFPTVYRMYPFECTHGSSLSVDSAQVTNLMGTQDTNKAFIQVRPPCGVIPTSCVWLYCYGLCWVDIRCPRGVPCLSLYSSEGRVTNLKTNPSRLLTVLKY